METTEIGLYIPQQNKLYVLTSNQYSTDAVAIDRINKIILVRELYNFNGLNLSGGKDQSKIIDKRNPRPMKKSEAISLGIEIVVLVGSDIEQKRLDKFKEQSTENKKQGTLFGKPKS